MPFVRITLKEGRTPQERRKIADGVHQALVATANVPPDDRFQVVHEVKGGDFFFDPTYLDIPRTDALVVVQIFLNLGRTIEVKKNLYAAIATNLASSAGVRPEDVLVNLVEVARENWSFGRGAMSYPPSP